MRKSNKEEARYNILKYNKKMLGSNKFVELAILSFVYSVNFIKYRAVNMNTHKTIIFFLNVEFYFILAPEYST